MEDIYMPIRPETFLDDALKSFDVYFKSCEEKMLLYCGRGKTIAPEVRRKLHAEHAIDTLYILKRDRAYYESYLEEVLGAILGEAGLNTAEKSKLAYESIERSAAALFKYPKAKTIQHYKKVVFDTVDFVLMDSNSIHELINLTSFNFSLHNHCINVGLFGMGVILEILKFNPNLNCHEAVAGYFLHDIGKCFTPLEILHKQGTLTPIEWKFIKRHPEVGCQILQKYGALTQESEIIVYQHHERNNGKGYPRGLLGKDIHFLSKICTIADVFDALTSQRPYRAEYSSFDALKIMKDELQGEFDPPLFSLFVRLFKK